LGHGVNAALLQEIQKWIAALYGVNILQGRYNDAML